MKRWKLVILLLVMFFTGGLQVKAQCSICTKSAMQQGVKPAQGLNTGIIYLMLAPFAVVGYIGYKWWKNEHSEESEPTN